MSVGLIVLKYGAGIFRLRHPSNQPSCAGAKEATFAKSFSEHFADFAARRGPHQQERSGLRRWPKLSEPDQSSREAEERCENAQGFEGYANEPDEEEDQCEDKHHLTPSCELPVNERSNTFFTDMACQLPPRAVDIPRALSASATARNEVAPAF